MPPQRSSWNLTSQCALSKVCSLISWIANLLSSSLSLMFAKMSDFQDLNIILASVEYPPLSFVILGYQILQNSLDTCAVAAAYTSAAIVATCLDSSIKGALGLTSNVQSLEVAQLGLDEYFGTCKMPEISDNLGRITCSQRTDLPPPNFISGLSLELLFLSSNFTSLWNEKAWSWLSYWAAPLHWLMVPGRMLKTPGRNPALLLEAATDGRVAWPPKDNSSAHT